MNQNQDTPVQSSKGGFRITCEKCGKHVVDMRIGVRWFKRAEVRLQCQSCEYTEEYGGN